MTSFPGSPRTLKAGIVTIDADSAQVREVISFQFNPDTLNRTLQAQRFGGDGEGRGDALRLKGPAVEVLRVEAELDATDELEFPGQNPDAVRHGVHPRLAILESLVQPTSSRLLDNNALASSGALQIVPAQAPLALFVWGANRVLPVTITDFGIVEEAFDTSLNPIRATVSLSMRVVSVNDVGFNHPAGKVFMAYLKAREELAGKGQKSGLTPLGIGGVL